MTSNESSRISVVLLGDSHTGKSQIAKALCGTSAIVPAPYEPTLGTEMLVAPARYGSHDVELVVWDFPGNERYAPAVPGPVCHADVCVLVVDSSNLASYEHVDGWHDEYVRCLAQGIAMPAFVLVRNIVAAGTSVPAAVTHEACTQWCARQRIDPLLWPKELVGAAMPVPPVVDITATDLAGCTAADSASQVHTLRDHILHRGILRHAINSHLASILLPQTPIAHEKIHQGILTAAVVGDVRALPAGLAPAPGNVQDILTDSGDVLVAVGSTPMVTGGSGILCRNAHCGVIAVAMDHQVTVPRIRLYQELVMREGGLRDPNSVIWVVLGLHTPTRTMESTVTLTNFCEEAGILLVEVAAVFHAANVWSRIAAHVRAKLLDQVIQRSLEHTSRATTICPHREGGCEWSGSRMDLDKHLTTCGFVQLRCRWDGCTEVLPRKGREDHEKFCVHRPPVCHFCEKPYDGPLYEHLVVCTERDAFERTHVACPLALYGCPTTHVLRSDVASHLADNVAQHMQFMTAALQAMQTATLQMERRHMDELNETRAATAKLVEGLHGEVVLARAVAEKQQDEIRELRFENQELNERLRAIERR